MISTVYERQGYLKGIKGCIKGFINLGQLFTVIGHENLYQGGQIKNSKFRKPSKFFR